jgi:hypothetical protein
MRRKSVQLGAVLLAFPQGIRGPCRSNLLWGLPLQPAYPIVLASRSGSKFRQRNSRSTPMQRFLRLLNRTFYPNFDTCANGQKNMGEPAQSYPVAKRLCVSQKRRQ